jgi:hypothetical protein
MLGLPLCRDSDWTDSSGYGAEDSDGGSEGYIDTLNNDEALHRLSLRLSLSAVSAVARNSIFKELPHLALK